MKRANFTLVELLVVVGIIAVLAGLITPAVILAQQKGKVTQARSDIAAIIMALKGVESTYGKMWVNAGADYTVGGVVPSGSSYDAYENFILELSDPRAALVTTPVVNRRRMKFLEPRSGYDASSSATASANHPYMWLDPWGTEYVVSIDTSREGNINDTSRDGNINHPNGAATKVFRQPVIVYSCGPNGQNNKGLNIDYDVTAEKTYDDVASWQ